MKGTGVFLPRSYEDVVAAKRSEAQRSSSSVDVTASSNSTNRVPRKVSTEPSKEPFSDPNCHQASTFTPHKGASSKGTSKVASRSQINPSSSSSSAGSSPRNIPSSRGKSSTPTSSRSAQQVAAAAARQQQQQQQQGLQGVWPVGSSIAHVHTSQPPPPPLLPVSAGGVNYVEVGATAAKDMPAAADMSLDSWVSGQELLTLADFVPVTVSNSSRNGACTLSLLQHFNAASVTGQAQDVGSLQQHPVLAATTAAGSQSMGVSAFLQQQQQWGGVSQRSAPAQMRSAPVPALGAMQQQQSPLLPPVSLSDTVSPADASTAGGTSIDNTLHALRTRLAAARLVAADAAGGDVGAAPDAACSTSSGTYSPPNLTLQQLLSVSTAGAVYHSESLSASFPDQHSAPLFGLQQAQLGLPNSLGIDNSFSSSFGNNPNACGLLGGSFGASPAALGGPGGTFASCATLESDSGFALFTVDSNLDSAALALSTLASVQGVQGFSCSPMASLGSFDLRSMGPFRRVSQGTAAAQAPTAASLAPSWKGVAREGYMDAHSRGDVLEGLQLQGLCLPAVCAGMNAGTACLHMGAGAQHAQHAHGMGAGTVCLDMGADAQHARHARQAQHEEVAALAAVAAQRKLQQMVALEALQSQLRQDVVNLLPLI